MRERKRMRKDSREEEGDREEEKLRLGVRLEEEARTGLRAMGRKRGMKEIAEVRLRHSIERRLGESVRDEDDATGVIQRERGREEKLQEERQRMARAK